MTVSSPPIPQLEIPQRLEAIRRSTRAIVAEERSPTQCTAEVEALRDLIEPIAEFQHDESRSIAEGRMNLSQGLAISPGQAAFCFRETTRTAAFLKGLYQAIKDVSTQNAKSGVPVRILYAGCGPYATLALPLMSLFEEGEIVFELLDVNEESLLSARRLIARLGLDAFVSHALLENACTYRIPQDRRPHVIVSETLNTALGKEPQVSIERNLLGQCPEALFIPERIEVIACLETPTAHCNYLVDLGPIFTLDKESVASWAEIKGDRLPAATIPIADYDQRGEDFRARFRVATRIQVYRETCLGDNACSLTMLKNLRWLARFAPHGDLKFEYWLGSSPGLALQATEGTESTEVARKRKPDTLTLFKLILRQNASAVRHLSQVETPEAFIKELNSMDLPGSHPAERGPFNIRRHMRGDVIEIAPVSPANTLLPDWMPARIDFEAGPDAVEWVQIGAERFTEPFFAQTVSRHIRSPLNRFLATRASIRSLEEITISEPIAEPAGFIFHASRCGSTLVSRMLAQLPQCVVLSEAAPIDNVLGGRFRYSEITEDLQVTWLRQLVSIFGRQRFAQEKHLVVKFDCWHIHQLALIRKAFPQVPCIFLYRDPLETLVSHRRRPGVHTVPGLLDPAWRGPAELPQDLASHTDYPAWFLGQILAAAQRGVESKEIVPVNYESLPGFVESRLAKRFGIELAPGDAERLATAERAYSKDPSQHFLSDSSEKRSEASASDREAVERWMTHAYRQLQEAPTF